MPYVLNEMGYTDVGDSFEEMKIRADYRHFNFPYLYDGETQKISNAYGPSATPHLFIFDSDRKLRYEGRVDNNMREPLVTTATRAMRSMRCSPAAGSGGEDSFGRLLDQMAVQGSRPPKELEEIEKQPVELEAREHRRSQSPAQEFHRQTSAGGFLGHMVRPLPRRTSRIRNHVPDVRTPGIRSGDGQH